MYVTTRFPLPIRDVLAAFLLAIPFLPAQTAPAPGHWEYVAIDSGVHGNPTPVAGVVHRELVTMPANTPWLRLHFVRTWLDKGSYLRIVSLDDGDIMLMRQKNLEEWSFSSAYMNGGTVLVELIAGPGTAKNSFAIDKVMAGDATAQNPSPQTICGPTDDRFVTNDRRIGRLLPQGCTGWIIDQPTSGPDRCHLSAGHCAAPGEVLAFSVPASMRNCALRHPPVSLQFAVDHANSVHVFTGVGDDYWVFRCFPNPTSGLTTFQTQGSSFDLTTVMPAVGTAIRVTGFGIDGTDSDGAPGANASCTCVAANNTGTRNQTLQTHDGAVTSYAAGDVINHQIDSCGGNSGSPILDLNSGKAIGIHTNGGCGNPVGATVNSGTQITKPALQAAIATVCVGPPRHGNDECAQALAVTNGANGTYTNNGATDSQPPFSCGSNVGKDCWFMYLATCTGSTRFDTCSYNRTLDTVLEVFDGCGGNLLGCNDDMGAACGSGSLASMVAVNTMANQRYWIRVGGQSRDVGNFDLNITPCNIADECADALPLMLGLNGPYSNAGATTSAPAWACGQGGNDVWFEYTIQCAQTTTLTLSTCPGASFDTVIEAFSGNCNGLTSIGCNDTWCGRAAELEVPVVAAQTVLVRVGGSQGAMGTFMLLVKENQPNDECGGAVAVVDGINGSFCNLGADQSVQQWPCGNATGADVWFSYHCGHTGNLAVSTCTATRSFDTVLEVFDGSCGSPVSLACNDDGGGGCGRGSAVTVPVTGGLDYLIRVGGYQGAQGSFDLVIGGTAANDHCQSATPVTLGTNGPFANATSTTSLPAWNCGLAACDVWFRFTAGCAGQHTFSTCTATATFDTVLEVFAGSCNALQSLGCNDDACGTGSRLSVNLQNGVDYLVRVGGFLGATGNFDLVVDTGNGNGTVTRLAHACGPTTIAATGSPNVGGRVTISLGNVARTPFIGLGLTLMNTRYCTACTIGPNWAAAVMGSSHTLSIPCTAAVVGLRFHVQGADFKAPGGCTVPVMTLTDTLTFTIG
ncbi:MAG: hypothetical protein KDC98_02445 [Planctomycetes bacterium]|nr:hypothetical protein [Planctomycetota bacterium]